MDVKTIERNIVREQDIHPQINYSGKTIFITEESEYYHFNKTDQKY